jgi:hypothetical protein
MHYTIYLPLANYFLIKITYIALIDRDYNKR